MKARQYKTVFITGVTDGLGLATAKIFLRKNWSVIGLGRKPESEVDKSIRNRIKYLQIDLSEDRPLESVPDLLHFYNISKIDVFILNAATGYHGKFTEQSEENIRQIFQVNLWAPVRLTQIVLPWLRRCNGTIVFISSIMSQLGTPEYSVYTASKAALEGFARNLAVEEEGNLQVLVKCPGAMSTNLHLKVGYPINAKNGFKIPERVANALVTHVVKKKKTKFLFRLDGFIKQALAIFHFFQTFICWISLNTKSAMSFKTVVITGAANGIGQALAREYVNKSEKLVLIDKCNDGLKRIKKELSSQHNQSVEIISTDVRDPQLSQKLGPFIPAQQPVLFFHNAGINFARPFFANSRNQLKQMLEVNLVAPILLTRLLVNQTGFDSRSKLVFTSSLSHFVSYPGASFYAATKDGIFSFSKSLGCFLNSASICPGPTETNQAKMNAPRPSAKRMAPKTVAQKVRFQLSLGLRLVLPGRITILIAFLSLLFNRLIRFSIKHLLWYPIKRKWFLDQKEVAAPTA